MFCQKYKNSTTRAYHILIFSISKIKKYKNERPGMFCSEEGVYVSSKTHALGVGFVGKRILVGFLLYSAT
jgi:hypothetical protein